MTENSENTQKSDQDNSNNSQVLPKSPNPPTELDRNKVGSALEVTVDDNIERAMKVLKRKLIKEGLFKELKSRRYYEKPSDRRKRKLKESLKKIRKEEARQKKNLQLMQ